MTTKRTKSYRPRGSGTTRRLPSGRWQARFRDDAGTYHAAAATFDTKGDAVTWLERQTRLAAAGIWTPPQRPASTYTVASYAERWLVEREIKPSTREFYRGLLDHWLLPLLGELELDQVDPAAVRRWYAAVGSQAPTRRAHAYSLLRSIYVTAIADEVVDMANPCRIKGAGQAKSKHQTKVASLDELERLVLAMPERYRAMVLLAAWCALRFGELAALRRVDVDLETPSVRVARGVVRVGGKKLVGTPKSDAGLREVSLPPHLVDVLKDHLDRFVDEDPGSLVFPATRGGYMAPSSLYQVFYPARTKIGRPDLRFHDLRHTGATLAAATGATLAELMDRLGHSTPSAAMRYQHAAADRGAAIAEALSGFATAKVVPLRAVQ